MRRRRILRRKRVAHAAVGVVALAGPVSAALAASPSGTVAATPSTQTLKARLKSHRVGYGQTILVRGQAPTSDSGQTVTLEYDPAGSSSWQPIAFSQVAANGSFRLIARPTSSGRIRVSIGSPPADALAAATASPTTTPPQPVFVRAALRLSRREHTLLGSGAVHVTGALLPRTPGERVQLQAWRAGRWMTLTSARTHAHGRFKLTARVSSAGREALRVRFRGNRANAGVAHSAGHVTVLHQSTASWYEDGGNTACGFHAYYGVANLSLPCGAHVTFSYGGRTVTATVDDRGPYVGGREWDLNQNTAAALGFAGVAGVWSSS